MCSSAIFLISRRRVWTGTRLWDGEYDELYKIGNKLETRSFVRKITCNFIGINPYYKSTK